MDVYTVGTPPGADGEWELKGVFTTKEAACRFVHEYNAHRPWWAHLDVTDIECWPLDAAFNPADYPEDKHVVGGNT